MILEKNLYKFFEEALKLVEEFIGREEAFEFVESVDYQKLGLLDYPQKIKEPVCLTEIREELQQFLYKEPTEFIRKMNLVFNNAMVYNTPGSTIYGNAKSLKTLFEHRLARMLAKADSENFEDNRDSEYNRKLKILEEKLPEFDRATLAVLVHVIREHRPIAINCSPEKCKIELYDLNKTTLNKIFSYLKL